MSQKFRNYIIICILMSLCFACNREKVDYAIVRGKVLNADRTLKLIAAFGSDNEDIYIPVNENGSFIDTIYTNNGQYTIFDGKNMIGFYIKPSKEYIIDYDANSFRETGIKLSGNDTLYNKYFIQKSQNQAFINPAERTSESDIRNYLNSIKERQLKRLNASNLSEELKAFEKEKIQYQYLVDLVLCLYYAEIKNPTKASIDELTIDYNNEKHYKTFGPYNRLVGEHYNLLLEKDSNHKREKDSSYSDHQNALKFFTSAIPNDYIRNDIISKDGLYHFKNATNIKEFYQDYKSYYSGTNESFTKDMLDLYSRLSKLEQGTQSPKFYNYKNYKGGTNSLDDYKGKIIYIDMWATWCGNCYNEMPALNKITVDYKDKNIVFVSIAWKDDEAAWRKVISTKDLLGIQLLADDADNSFFDEYGVYGIPRYILIDQVGNIIDYNAPAPSDEKLNELLNSILD